MSSTEIIKVNFTPPTGIAGGARVEYCDNNNKPLTSSPTVAGGTSKTFCLQLGLSNGWYFYAISFWGEIRGSGAAQSTLAECFLDGWYKGASTFSPNGKPFAYISDIYVNRDSNNNQNQQITFTINNTNGSEGQDGTIGLEVTFTNSTQQADQTRFLTGRDPEIELLKSPPN